MQDVRVCSHDGPIRCRTCGYVLTTDQSDAGRAGMFSQRTSQMQDVWVCSHDRPIRCRTCGYVLTTDQSDAGRA
eukprot:1303165-Pyramimonas_sp.AAC.1